jgi:hypothetical protein
VLCYESCASRETPRAQSSGVFRQDSTGSAPSCVILTPLRLCVVCVVCELCPRTQQSRCASQRCFCCYCFLVDLLSTGRYRKIPRVRLLQFSWDTCARYFVVLLFINCSHPLTLLKDYFQRQQKRNEKAEIRSSQAFRFA